MNFQERMKALARKNAQGVAKYKWYTVTVALRVDEHVALSRLSKASGETITTVVREFLEANIARLTKLATELERGVGPVEKLPTRKEIKSFADAKKRGKK